MIKFKEMRISKLLIKHERKEIKIVPESLLFHLAPGTIIFERLSRLSSSAVCLILEALISCLTLKIFLSSS